MILQKNAVWWDRFILPGFQGSMVSPVTLLESLGGHLEQPEWHMTSCPNAVGVAPHAWNHHLSQLGRPLSLLASWSILPNPKRIFVWPPKIPRFLKKNTSGRPSAKVQKTLTGISKAGGLFRRDYFRIASLQVDEKWLPIFDDGKFTTLPVFTENLLLFFPELSV